MRMILHLALPFALRATAERGWPRGRSAALAAYDVATVLIASPRAARRLPTTPSPRRPKRIGVARVVCGGIAGGAMPSVVRAAVRTSPGATGSSKRIDGLERRGGATARWTSRAAPSGVVPAMRTALVAAAEEAIWRAPIRSGDHVRLGTLAAAGASVAGFALLHLPVGGPRALPYTALFGAVASAFALSWGTPSAVAFHVAHNLVLRRGAPGGSARSARSTRATAEAERAPVAEIPSEATW